MIKCNYKKGPLDVSSPILLSSVKTLAEPDESAGLQGNPEEAVYILGEILFERPSVQAFQLDMETSRIKIDAHRTAKN